MKNNRAYFQFLNQSIRMKPSVLMDATSYSANTQEAQSRLTIFQEVIKFLKGKISET